MILQGLDKLARHLLYISPYTEAMSAVGIEDSHRTVYKVHERKEA